MDIMNLNDEIIFLQRRGYDEEKVREILLKKLQLEQQEVNLPQPEALTLARRIRPIISVRNEAAISSDEPENEYSLPINGKPYGKKYWIDGLKIRTQSYVLGNHLSKKQLLCPAHKLTPITEIETYHRCGYWAFLKPSVYEVLYQIPEVLRDKVCAFELYADSENGLSLYDMDLGRHRLHCILYQGEMPFIVSCRKIEW